MCTTEANRNEGRSPEEHYLNTLAKQYADHVSGELPLPPAESLRLRREIERVSQIVNPGQQNLWGDYSPQEKQYLAEQAQQNRQAANNLGIWVGGPVFSALPALGRVLDAPDPVVEGLGQINAELAGAKAFGRQGRGIQPVRAPVNSAPVKTYVLDTKSVRIKQPVHVKQEQGVETNNGFTRFTGNYDEHIIFRDYDVPRKRGIGGAHNRDEFLKYSNEYKIEEIISHPSVDGVETIRYRMAALDPSGNPTGSYRAIVLEKTVYDPAKISNAQFIDWGRQAAAEAQAAGKLNREWVGTAPNGLEFRGYLNNTGAVKSFFPNF